jgi:hypothetical protein
MHRYRGFTVHQAHGDAPPVGDTSSSSQQVWCARDSAGWNRAVLAHIWIILEFHANPRRLAESGYYTSFCFFLSDSQENPCS